jgi:hypothetical protein
MAKADTPDERAMIEHDKETLARALSKVRAKKKKDAGDRQIEEKLESMTGAADFGDPQRYHGS